ncbi:MAG: hypothetical protein WCT39_05880, partial [Candidatus Margulisiibacteriota bacterium]
YWKGLELPMLTILMHAKHAVALERHVARAEPPSLRDQQSLFDNWLEPTFADYFFHVGLLAQTDIIVDTSDNTAKIYLTDR